MILVTGATGNVGRNVVEQLVESGEQVRATTRNPEQADVPRGVEVVRADLEQPDTLPTALKGAERAFLFPVHGRLGEFLDAAKDSGLRHVVLLSASAAGMEEAGALGRVHLESEKAVAESGLPWTAVRPGAFMANDLGWAPGIKAQGVVRGPYADSASAPIDERDIAAVVVRALLDDGHAGKVHELTGPQSLTPVDRVRILGEVLGRDLRFEEQPVEEAREQMRRYAPAEIVDALLNLSASLLGTTAAVSPTVQEVTGRAPRTFAEWAAHHAADFR